MPRTHPFSFLLGAVLAATAAGQNPSNSNPIYVVQNVSTGAGSKPVVAYTWDLDGDNDFDFVSANGGSDTITVGRNGGSGTFTTTTIPATAGDSGISSVARGVDLDGDNRRNDVVACYRDSHTVVTFKNVDASPPPSATSEALPSTLRAPVHIDTGRSGSTPIVVVACEGRLISGGGGAGVKIGNGTFQKLGSSRSKYSRCSLRDLDGDGDLDLVLGGPGYTDLYEGITSAGAFTTFSSAGGFTENTLFTENARAVDVDGDGNPDLSVVVNDVFNTTPTASNVVRFNSGSGSLGTARFSTVKNHMLSRGPYCRAAVWGNRYDADINGHMAYRSRYVFYWDFKSVRCSGLYDRVTRDFVTGATQPPVHDVATSVECDDIDEADMDGNGTGDLVVCDSVNDRVQIHKAVHYPHDDAYGTGCGTSTLSTVGAPQIGTTWSLQCTADQPGRLVLFLFAAEPANTSLGPCKVLVGSAGFCPKLAFTRTGSKATVDVDVPNDTTLLDQDVHGQAVVFRPGGALGGRVDLTDARRGRVGDCQ